VRQGQPALGWRGEGQPHPAAEVLPEVHHEGVPVAHRPHGGRPDLLHPADRGRQRADDRDVDVTRDGHTPRPAAERGVVERRVVERRVVDGRVVHGRVEQPAVLSLAADEIGRGDVGRRDAPARVAGRHHLPALLGLHFELGAQRHVVAVLVGRPRQPDLAAIPPVGKQDGEDVAARPHE
jgi:hypothetical protein